MRLRIATKLLLASVFLGSALLMGNLVQANHEGFDCTVKWQSTVTRCEWYESVGDDCEACKCYTNANCTYQKCINIDHLNICLGVPGAWDTSECNDTCGRIGQILE